MGKTIRKIQRIER